MESNRRNPITYFFFSVFIVFFSFSLNCSATNVISRGELIRDGQTVVSEDQKFVLGFFSPVDSRFRYVGIWYNEIPVQSVIWVANRDTPVTGPGGILTIGNDGNIVVLNGNGALVWSSNASALSGNSSNNSTTATLKDNGDLTLTTVDNLSGEDRVLWESFEHPTDTFLPDMRIRVDPEIGEIRAFTSWRSANDPSNGSFSLGVDPRVSPQIVIWEGENRRWRSGHWNGVMFIGVPRLTTTYLYGFQLDEGRDGRYFTYNLMNRNDSMRFLIRWDGVEEQLRWDRGANQWERIQSRPANECDLHNKCGPFGKCRDTDSPICSCLQGFVPKNLDEWNDGNWSGGCIRRTELTCGTRNGSLIERESAEEDGFFKIERAKLPDYLDFVGAEELEDCRTKCLMNCSCKAYACVNGISCMIWYGDLVDVQIFEDGGNDLYIRLADSELVESGDKTRKLIIITVVVIATFFLCVSIWLLWSRRGKLKAILFPWKKNNENPEFVVGNSRKSSVEFSGTDDLSIEGNSGTGSGSDLEVYNFSRVAAATNNFSDENKLGQGGFGSVYKGILPGGQEIAVKRLSRRSGQGNEEFKNEITLIAKLQHRNLVRLLGCCIEGEEKMLLYEYMPNKSLDSYIFGELAKQAQLNWKKRLAIIEGIARGLLYLHRDSRLRIIHRDLKASNILLDDEMNPKISDFGMARIFGGNQNEANTNRIVGTYGYMSPEYAMEGLFSVKSDVYSFGVLLLEIISGRKNTSYRSPEYSNIIGYAWDLWDRGKAMELVDPSIVESCSQEEVLKCMHVGMLCVQDSAGHRPTMSTVVLMLESENTALPPVRQPTFTSMHIAGPDSWKENQDAVSSNNVTISVIFGR